MAGMTGTDYRTTPVMNDTQGGVMTILTMPVRHPLDQTEAFELIEALGMLGLPVVLDLDDLDADYPAVHVWPLRDMSPRDETTVLRMIIDRTDERVMWAR